MKKKIVHCYKPRGITPLEVIKQFKKVNPEYEKEKIGYAGRLDPMAEGVLLLLIGEENKNKKHYEDLEKEYKFTLLFGVATDTYDILGKIEKSAPVEKVTLEKAHHFLSLYQGKHIQFYPPYSSFAVQGKPLFYWARRNKLQEITIPSHTIEVFSIKFLNSYTLYPSELEKDILSRIKKVKGDFRTEEITTGWEIFFKTRQTTLFFLATYSITCSSGTYIRSIAHEVGQKLGCYALAFSIKRTHVGEYILKNAKKMGF